jgi:transposase-like protein
VTDTTDAIESLNAQLRKIIKTRGHFPSDDAARKLIATPFDARARALSNEV